LYRWKDKIESQLEDKLLSVDELTQLRKEVFNFIRDESLYFPVTILCQVMRVSTSAYYAWNKRPG